MVGQRFGQVRLCHLKPLGGDGDKEGKKAATRGRTGLPSSAYGTFKQAGKAKKEDGKQGELWSKGEGKCRDW